MGKPRKLTPEEQADWERRDREFQELLERRREVDARLRAEREAREREQERRGT